MKKLAIAVIALVGCTTPDTPDEDSTSQTVCTQEDRDAGNCRLYSRNEQIAIDASLDETGADTALDASCYLVGAYSICRAHVLITNPLFLSYVCDVVISTGPGGASVSVNCYLE